MDAAVIVAIGSLIVSVIAAIASFRSAGAAQQSAALAARTLERAALREIIRSANEVVAEAGRIEMLIVEALAEYKTLFNFAEQFGGSRHKLYVDELEKKRAEVGELARVAVPIASDPRHVESASERDVTSMLASLDAALAKMRPMREALERELSGIAAQNAAERERRLSKMPGQ